ncbi:MAG: hypothetical protein KDD45_00630 [Bdellovibrionales bacterium]|nr:hypothetical protein [Bdellovibrionales bacterium]
MLLQQQIITFGGNNSEVVSPAPVVVGHGITYNVHPNVDALTDDYLIWYRTRTYSGLETVPAGYTDLGGLALASEYALSMSICGRQIPSSGSYADAFTFSNAHHGYILVRGGTFNFGDVATHAKLTGLATSSSVTWAASGTPARLVVQIACARENQTDLAPLLSNNATTLLDSYGSNSYLDMRVGSRAGSTPLETKTLVAPSSTITAVLVWQ